MIKLLHVALSHGKNGLTDALRGVCDEYAEAATSDPEMNAKICHLLDSFSPTIVWIQIQNEGLTDETLIKLRDSTAYVINWSGDVRQVIPEFYWHYGEYVDVTCFSNMNDVKMMARYGYNTKFLQIGYDPEIYTPEGEKKQVEDIVFMGNNHGGFPLSVLRYDMVHFLKQVYGSRFGVYGTGWGGIESGNYMGDQHGEAAVLRSAKIAINLSHFDYERYSSDRLFRALGCGVCVVTHRYDCIDRDFVDGRHVMTWRDFEEMKGIIDWLSNHDWNRQQVAQIGLELAKKYFSFEKMAKDIIEIWESRNIR